VIWFYFCAELTSYVQTLSACHFSGMNSSGTLSRVWNDWLNCIISYVIACFHTKFHKAAI